MFLSWKGALLYVTWGSLYGYLMKTYWKWRWIMQYWYDSSAHRKKCLFQLFPLHARQKENKRKQQISNTTHQKYSHCESKHTEMHGSKWQGRKSSPWFQLSCDVSCREWDRTILRHPSAFGSPRGDRVGKDHLHICLECGAKSNSRTQYCWQK